MTRLNDKEARESPAPRSENGTMGYVLQIGLMTIMLSVSPKRLPFVRMWVSMTKMFFNKKKKTNAFRLIGRFQKTCVYPTYSCIIFKFKMLGGNS